MSRPDSSSSPQDAFDRAARQSLRESPLPAPPAWLDTQIQSAARAQAQRYAAQSKPRAPAWWQAPWLKVALPTVVVATLLVAVWLPQTQVTEQAVFLPDAARVERAAPTAAAPAAVDQPVPPTPSAAQHTADGATAAATGPTPTPMVTPAEPAKPLAKAASAPEAKAAKPPPIRQQTEPERQRSTMPAEAPIPPASAPAAAPAASTPPAAPALAIAGDASNLPPQTAVAPEMHSEPAVVADRAAPPPASNRSLMARTGEARSGAAVPSAAYSSAARASVQAPIASSHHEFEAIRQMLREGKRDEAAKRLRTLVERQPAMEVPEDLRPLLIKP